MGSFFQNLITGIINLLRRLLGLILPFITEAREYEGWGTGLRWILRIVLLAGISAGLWWVNYYFEVDKFVLGTVPGQLRGFFLPVLFLLICALCWLGWLLWKLLGPEEESVDFPDIRVAWDEGVRALNQAGIDLTEVPLFLVVGKPVGGEEALFNAAQLQLTVKFAPQRQDAPLHLFGNRDAVYVTCAGASLLGRQAAILAGEVGATSSPSLVPEAGGADGGMGEEDMFKTMRAGEGKYTRAVQAILAKAHDEGRGPEQLSEEERAEVRRLMGEDRVTATAKPRINLLKSPQDVELLTARLKYLCRLIVRDRHPYCPLNGVLILVPYAAGDSEDTANQTGQICHQDLTSLRQALQVHCPQFAMICDLETAPGFREFITRFPADQRQRRLGQRFPLQPDLNPNESATDLMDKGVQWISTSLFPSWIYKLFRVETPGGKDNVAAVLAGNMRLYQLLNAMRERRTRLGRVVARGLTREGNEPLLFGGCYIAGTGRSAAQEQAFVAGVYRRLVENQNFVSWTGEAVQQESDYERWTRYGYLGIAFGSVALIAFLGFAFFSQMRSG